MRFLSSSAPLVGLLLSCLTFPTLTQSENTNTTTSNVTSISLPSLFISPSRDLVFSLSVPSESDTDLYFSLMIPQSVTWGAIGLGSSQMAGALMLIAYASASGTNVTLSPRLASGHSEPVYTPDIRVEALDGTGLIDDSRYVFNGCCSNCRVWDGGEGKIDVTSRAQSFLYATGPDGDVRSDNPDAPLKMHLNYGTFTLDMVHATSTAASAPVIPVSNSTSLVAAVQGLSVTNARDRAAQAHAVIMIFCFVGLFPFGILVLRLGNWVRWHAVNQGLAAIGVVVGFGLGVNISSLYNRSKKFNNAHQVIGILLFIFVLAQFVLGFMHHRVYKKTQQPTKLAPIHVWMGRIIIPVGVINGFLGFRFAQSPQYNYILAGLVIFIFPVVGLVLFTKKFLRKRWERTKSTDAPGDGGPSSYDMDVWRQPEAAQHQGGGLGQNPPFDPYAAHLQQQQRSGEVVQASVPTIVVGRQPDNSYAPYQSSAGGHKRADLGLQQQVREYV